MTKDGHWPWKMLAISVHEVIAVTVGIPQVYASGLQAHCGALLHDWGWDRCLAGDRTP